ncbi:MAG: acyl-CoA thioesterase [Planctomycetota bacterium]
MRRRWQRPPPTRFLEETTDVEVRFQEVDALGIVWHGHYLTYFEVARFAFGKRYGLDYQTILDHGYIAPIVRSEVDYYLPARYGDVLTLHARLHPDRGARVTFSYLVCTQRGEELAAGLTVQVFTDLSGELVLVRPDFYEKWLEGVEFKSA